MNAEKYRQDLINHAIPSVKCVIGFIFQHDHDPKHTANAVKSYLERKTADKTLTVVIGHHQHKREQLAMLAKLCDIFNVWPETIPMFKNFCEIVKTVPRI